MDYPISIKDFKNRSRSSTKKRALGTKKILVDSNSVRHNSLITNPIGGKFFERIDTNYIDIGWKFLPNKSHLNQNNTNFFNNEEEVVPEIREGEHRSFCIN